MDHSLEAVDAVRERAGVTYREAKEALEQAGGDLVEALAGLEESRAGMKDHFSDMIIKAKHAAVKLHQTRMKIKVNDNALVELPVTYSALGIAFFPKLATLGVIGLLLSKGSIEVNGEPEDS